MPRQSRINAPGALHHIIARGNERRKIFTDDQDRERFLERLGEIVTETQFRCYCWSLMPNHFHLLLRTDTTPISTVMRRLLTGRAIGFNRRHRRWGHLFQNRFKSILCQEDPCFLELVRYIHLNPLRAKLVADIRQLDSYPYSGHSVIMGGSEFIESVLRKSEEAYEIRFRLRAQGWDIDRVAERVAKVLQMDVDEVWSPGMYQRLVAARSLLCYWAVRELGVSMTILARW